MFCYHAGKSRVIGAAVSDFELLSHAGYWSRITAAQTSRRSALYGSVKLRIFDFVFRIGLVDPSFALLYNDLEIDALGSGLAQWNTT